MPTHPTALHLIIAKNELYLQYAIQIYFWPLTCSCITVVPNLVGKLIISCPESVSSTHSKFDVSLQPPCFTNYSLMISSFEKLLTNNSQNCELIYNNIPKY